MGIDYVAEFYKLFFRSFIKDIAKRYPDNLESTLESEMEYVRKKLEDERLYYIFEDGLTRRNFNIWRYGVPEDMSGEDRGKGEFSKGVDFSSMRENSKGDKDIVWVLRLTGAKYPGKKSNQITRGRGVRFKQFERLLQEIGFSEREKQLFYYGNGDFYFNGLKDNGDIVYAKQHQEIPSHKGFLVSRGEMNKYLFDDALEESDIDVKYGELEDLLDLCYKTQKSESVQKMDAQDVIKVAEKFSNLIPIIDRYSKLKCEEELREERIAVRFAVFHFFMPEKWYSEEAGNDCLKNILLKHFEDYILGKALLGEVCAKEKFNYGQTLVITERYLELLERNLKLFKDKVERFQKMCNKLQGESQSVQLYRDLWVEYADGFENE